MCPICINNISIVKYEIIQDQKFHCLLQVSILTEAIATSLHILDLRQKDSPSVPGPPWQGKHIIGVDLLLKMCVRDHKIIINDSLRFPTRVRHVDVIFCFFFPRSTDDLIKEIYQLDDQFLTWDVQKQDCKL